MILEKTMELHGNYNHPITAKKRIYSSKEDLWNLISKPGYLNLVHPFCKQNNVISWKSNNHSDELIYHNNLKFIRDFIKWNEKNGYELVIGEKNKKKSLVKWKISLVNNKTYLSITVYPYLMNQYPKIMSFLPYLIYIKPMLKSYLNSVLMGINWYLKTKKKVSKNQFGKHEWFS